MFTLPAAGVPVYAAEEPPVDVRVDATEEEVYVDNNGIFQVRFVGASELLPGDARFEQTDSYSLYDGQPVFTDWLVQ